MSWIKAVRIAAPGVKTVAATLPSSFPLPVSLPKPKRPKITTKVIDWDRLVVLDFETYWDVDYTLSKLSTSEYVRDPRFKAQMVGVKIGNAPTVIIPHEEISDFLATIDWSIHTVLCHNTAFDGFILGHHYGVFPYFVFDTLSMARGLHSNDIGAGLDEVAQFYGRGQKIIGALEPTKGVLDWDDELFSSVAKYCVQDVELTLAIFKQMHVKMPVDEMDLIDHTIRMFTQPCLLVDIPRVEVELQRELDERQAIFDRVYSMNHDPRAVGLTKTELALPPQDLKNRIVKKVVGSNELFANLLKMCGLTDQTIPRKLSPTWLKKRMSGQIPPGSTPIYVYAFSRDDLDFTNLPNREHLWVQDLDLNNSSDVLRMKIRANLLDLLIEARLTVKSTTNITRAERFLTAGANGMPLPAGYSYFRAHTGRWGGNNKMNMQNLKRPEFDATGTPLPGTGELRQSILAPEGHVLVVADSGQIEARVNAWLWGQEDLLQSFRDSDAGTGADPYCVAATDFYGKPVTKKDKLERFLGKVITLGLGFGMGPPKFQLTLAKGALGGPPIDFTLNQCQKAVYGYRGRNAMIVNGWAICNQIIEDMFNGKCGSFGPLTWEKEKIWLPNGMCLQYPDLKGEPGERGTDWTYRAGKGRTKLYGGLLCENLVQALARIIVGEQLIEIGKKMRVVMITHDEIVTCVRAENGALAFKLMESAMRTAPAWCHDIPLNAEGGFAVNYSK